MPRKYTLNRRAAQQAETRQRIVEAAVELHGSVGPAETTISMIAEKAGVQRHTFYAHFPDERAMLMACSGHSLEVDPLPDPAPWERIAAGEQRLRTGLRAIYDWYERNAALVACVLRDAERDTLVREISDLRFGAAFARYQRVLAAKLTAAQRPMLALALSFHSWRTLTQEAGLKQSAATSAMTHAILQQGRPS